ncbi:MAG: S1C family serine protease [bacterium]
MRVVKTKFDVGLVVCLLLVLPTGVQLAFAGETLAALEKEILVLIGSTKESIVTVTSYFSQEVSIEKERGILSFFRSETEKKSLSYINIGSGVIFNEAGYILTRSSIVWGAEKNVVTLVDGREVPAQFVGQDPETGLSVLKIEVENVAPARLGDSDEVLLGSWNFMIGNSLGVYPSITFGSVNGLRNDGMIQLSAILNPGNNGSPIINLQGEVVGVVAGQLNPASAMSELPLGDFHSPTLAYPINWVKRIANDIIKFGYVRKGWLGVVGYRDGQKPKVSQIKEDSPAQQAGLVEGDVILRFSYKEVRSISELARLVEYTPPGETVSLEYRRGDKILLTNVKVGEKTAIDTLAARASFPNPGAEFLPRPSETLESRNVLLHFLEKNEVLERRINRLESEMMRLKKLLESY